MSSNQPPQLLLFDAVLNELDRESLKNFLTSPLGNRVLRHLYATCPDVTDARGDLHFRAGIASGWKQCVESLSEMTQPPQTKDQQQMSSAFPDLDDESKWSGTTPKSVEFSPNHE